MRHFTVPDFWEAYDALPSAIQRLADKNYELLKANPRHPSLHFKRVKRYWSVRVNQEYRAMGVPDGEDVVWFWIGPHDEYDEIIKRS